MYQAVENFSIKTPRGEVIIKAGQVVALPEDTVKALLKKGKIKGASISWDALSSIHLQVARTLATQGVDFRLSTSAITETENELNRIWLDCLHGKASIDDFKAINEQWANAIRATSERVKRGRLF